MTTYTNLGITKIVTGDSAGLWGGITNDNFDLFDTSICGIGGIIAPAAGTSGSPNNLPIVDGSALASAGRNRVLNFTSASNLGATVYYQITPDNFQGYYFVQNNLTGPQDLTIFQGDYNAGRALTISGGQDAVIRCDGLGALLSTVTAVLSDMTFNSLNVTTSGVTPTSVMNYAAVNTAVSAASIAFVSGDQILFRGAALPSGWAVAAQNDKALRIVSGTPGSGGTVTFSAAFNTATITGSTVLTAAQSGVGSHAHTYTYVAPATSYTYGFVNPGQGSTVSQTISATTNTSADIPASAGHTHSIPNNVLYYDMQVIQKS